MAYFLRIYAFIVVSMMFTKVESSGVFELRLKSFANELGRDTEGNCCKGTRTSSGVCSSSCQTKFRVCLKHYQQVIDYNSPCTFGDVITPVVGNNNIIFSDKSDSSDGYTNPIAFPFGFSWPGTFSLIVEAWHETSSNSPVATPEQGRRLIFRMATQRFLDIEDSWTEDREKVGHTALSYEYRVRCDEHYFGESCAIICRPRDDTFGHYRCSDQGDKICLPGWTGEYCTEAICLPGCHSEHGSCNDPNECLCKLGWQGKLCDQCIRYPGCLHGTCQQPWQCQCNEGWGGLFCNQDLNYCTNHKPCKNGGECANTGQGSYTCKCAEGYTGTDCEIIKDDCEHQPCLNGGLCKGSGTSVTCECPPGFHGRRCETFAQTCEDRPCLHGGTCLDTPDGYLCLCPPGFEGVNCGHQIDDCADNPCRNGGSCVDKVNGFKCICPSGYTGDLCETDVNDCKDNPCLNGGICIDMVNAYRCQCVPGFMGSLCQTNVDDCLTKPCANGGLCKDLVNDYMCTCKAGFTGKDCSIEINECLSAPCRNGGTCIDRVNEFICRCPLGFSGDVCERTPAGILGETDYLVKNVTQQSETNDSLSGSHIAVIATMSVLVPLLALISCAAIIATRRRRRRDQIKSDEEARRQNEQNVVHSISKKMDKCLEEHRIVNTLDFPKSKCVNAGEDFSKDQLYTLHRTRSQKIINTDHNKLSVHENKLDKDYISKDKSRSQQLDTRLSLSVDTSVYISDNVLKRPTTPVKNQTNPVYVLRDDVLASVV
ncbi:neurogenic locus protein delta-like [Artemia franciscana]|uniref:neurogenic locus protein delta-like n=1 Tax=Artemia franciscana TaxID=6661 RepID=UPI0032DAC874